MALPPAFWCPILLPTAILELMKYQNQASGIAANLACNETKESKMHMLLLSYKEKTIKKQKNKLHFVSWDLKQLQEEEGGDCKTQWTF